MSDPTVATESTHKVADRPHRITILIGLLSALLAIVAVVFSALSIRISGQAVGISEQSLQVSEKSLIVGQRAYVHAKLHTENAGVKEYPHRWLLGVELINTGNTPAKVTGVTAEYQPDHLPSIPEGWELGNVSQQTYVIGGKESEKVAFGSATIDFPKPLPGYPPGGHLLPSVSVHYLYTDVFNDTHSGGIECDLVFDNGSISQPRCSTKSSDFIPK
jgi:hypothetical protein